jgi:iron complex outermembrane recepter protein
MSYFKFIVAVVALCLYADILHATNLNTISTNTDKTSTIITGVVYSSDTNEPISGAHVWISDPELMAVTNADGLFSLELGTVTEPITVRISHIGFRPITEKIEPDELQSGSPLQFVLNPSSEMMSPLTVLSHRVMNSPSNRMGTDKAAFLPIDSGQFLREAGNASGIRKGGFGIDPVLRGLSGSRLNVRLDGLTATAAACPNRMDPPTSHIRLSDIERVEIHRGPHALQYGPSFGGTVNFVSHKSPDYINFGLNGDVRAGIESNTGHQKTDARIQGGTENWDFLLSGGLSSTDDYTGGNGLTVASGFQSYDFGLEGGINVFAGHRLTAGWSQSFIRDADFPALMMDMAVDDTYKFKAGYKWTPNQAENLSEVEINGYWSLVDHEMNNHNRDSFNMRDAIALAETETYGVHSKVKGQYNSGSYTVTAGIDQLDVTGTRFVDIKMGPQAGNSMTYNLWQDASIFNAGIYSGFEHFIDRWTISAGTRIDYNEADSNDPAPRFENTDVNSTHVNFSISAGITRQISTNTTAGFYVGRGVRSPDVTERYINFLTIGRDSYEYTGNPDLKAEANNQADLVLKSEIGNFSIETTIFASYMTNYISAVINEDLQPVGMGAPGVREFQNRGDALFSGFELAMNHNLSRSWHVGLNSSFTRAEYLDNNTPVAEIPPFESTLNIGGSLFMDRIMPGVSVRRVFPQNRFNEEFGESRTPGFWLVYATLSSSLYDGITLSGGVRNLLDEDYYEHLNRQFNPGVNPSGDYLPEPGRRFFAELSIRF